MSTKLDEFTAAYITAALWTETDDDNPETGGNPLDDNYTIDDLDSELVAEMAEDCRRFQEANAELITDENVATQSPDYDRDARAGHDFWLTRNGHGCGFWAGDWKEPAADQLTKAAHAFGEFRLTAAVGGSVIKM